MNNKFIFSFILSALILSISSNAYAWNLNHSYLNPALDYNVFACGSGEPTYTSTTTTNGYCCLHVVCGGSTNGTTDPNDPACFRKTCDNGEVTTITTQTGSVSVPKVNETCYHPSCYIRVANQVRRFAMPVQPLTSDTNLIKGVITSLTDEKIGNTPLDGNGGDSNFIFQYSYPNPNTKYSASVGYTSKWGAGTGTSAMQGLLWSWRMLSNKWHGVWKTRSDYENSDTAAMNRDASANSVPNSQNSKSIVIISDGQDSDGPSYKPVDANGNPAVGTKSDGTIPYVTSGIDAAPGTPNDGSLGFHRHDFTDNSPVFETCDSHAPLASITDADYEQVCQKMKDEGIRVYAILYLYSPTEIQNSRLAKCATITGGNYYTDVTPVNINQTLNALIAKIVARNIRLIK